MAEPHDSPAPPLNPAPCTWEGCKSNATHLQTAKDGAQWAHLCATHAAELEAACDIASPIWTPKRMLRAWILAQGGAGPASRRVNPYIGDTLTALLNPSADSNLTKP